jgi:protein kinase C substrate 80K-H
LNSYNDAESDLSRMRRDRENAQKALSELFDPAHFGSQGEWKKLDQQCLQKDSGE